jgi:hypothetical protein
LHGMSVPVAVPTADEAGSPADARRLNSGIAGCQLASRDEINAPVIFHIDLPHRLANDPPIAGEPSPAESPARPMATGDPLNLIRLEPAEGAASEARIRPPRHSSRTEIKKP